MMKKKITMKQYEKSAVDKKLDKKYGEGSAKDKAMDKKNIGRINAGKKPLKK